MNKKIILEDTTLRDGEQSPGLAFTKEAKIEIYKSLVNAGVKWLELGIPAMGGTELETIKILKNMAEDDAVTAFAWNRGVREDVEFSISLGFKAIHIGLPTSNIHLKDSIGKSRDWLLTQATELIKLAKDKGVFVSISAEDVGRTDIPFLQEYAGVVSNAGADRLRLSDTIGILTPNKYVEIIKAIRAAANIDLQSHAHNDFGLAVINTLVAIEAGVKYFHVTVNGIGERAGMPDLSQVVLGLNKFYGVDTGIKFNELVNLSKVVAKHTKTTLYPWQPIIGDNVFAHESGIHAKGTINNSTSFEPFPPEFVGGKRRIVIGKHSGRHSIKFVLEENGVVVDNSLLSDCLYKVRNKAMLCGHEVNVRDLIDIYAEVSGLKEVVNE